VDEVWRFFWRLHNCYNTFLPFLPPDSKPKPVKMKKRASRLCALEMLQEKSERKAKIKEPELKLRQNKFDFQKLKYEDEAAERKAKLQLELEERRVLLSMLNGKI